MIDEPVAEEDTVQTVCLLLGERNIPQYFFEAVNQMVESTGVEIAAVIVGTTPEDENDSNGLLFSVKTLDPVETIKNKFKYIHPLIDITESEYISANDLRTVTLKPAKGVGVRFPEEIVDMVSEQCDVGIHLRVGILKGEILNAPKRGVIGYHHGNLRKYRGTGYGFWEFMNDEDTAGITLQILTEDLDAGKVLHFKKVDISNATSFKETRQMLVEASIPMLAEGIQKLRNPEFVPEDIPEAELGDMYYSSDMTPSVKLTYLLKHFRQNLFY